MIVVFVCDGLRPDLINARRMPFVSAMKTEGAWCERSHAVFPSATRINSASLATGCYPSRHGIVDNELYVPAIDARRPISCADWRLLRRMAELEGGRLLTVETVGERLARAGRQMASAGSGSPGTTYLTNPETTGPVVNWAVGWPQSFKDDLVRRYGAMLSETSTSSERSRFVFDSLVDEIVPRYAPDLLTIWLTEPDHMQHAHGLGSPEADALLLEVDGLIESFVTHLHSHQAGPLTCFLTSDHGFSTIGSRCGEPEEELAEAGWGGETESKEIVGSSNSLYLRGHAREHLGEVVQWLSQQSWMGGIMVRDDLLAACPGAMPQSAVFGGHQRSAELMFSYRWSHTANAHGIPGDVIQSAPIAATHGSASPYDMTNTLMAWGEGIRAGVRSTLPCGIVDIAPTVLRLLGTKGSGGMEGRVLCELLNDGSQADDAVSETLEKQWTYGQGANARRQIAHYSVLGDHVYLDSIDWQ